jgi:hypothetical protein
MSPIRPIRPLDDITPGIYWLTAPEGTLAPRGIVRVVADERGFPTIWIDEQKRWPISMLPEGTELAPQSAAGNPDADSQPEEGGAEDDHEADKNFHSENLS